MERRPRQYAEHDQAGPKDAGRDDPACKRSWTSGNILLPLAAAPYPLPSAASGRSSSLDIKPEVVDPEDVEMLSDLITAAVNEALRKAVETSRRRMNKITGGLNIPGLV